MMSNNLTVSFYDRDAQGNCRADILIPGSGTKIQGFKVKPGPGGGIQVHMPAYMGTRWDCAEIEWAEVRRQVTDAYRNAGTQQSVRVQLYPRDEKRGCLADITICETGAEIRGFRVMQGLGGGIQVYMPAWMHNRWTYAEVSWGEVRRIIAGEYLAAGHAVQSGAAAEDIPGEKPAVQESAAGDGTAEQTCTEPSSVEPASQSETGAESFGEIARAAQMPQMPQTPQVPQVPKQPPKEKNELGRVKNADRSSLIFYPRTVLRLVEDKESQGAERGKKLFDLVTAMNKGSFGGIGPFEVNLLEWIARLRYVTSTMLLDLIRAKQVAFGWRSSITQQKLSRIIGRMADYDLINLTWFVSLADDGSLKPDSKSAMRIISLGKNGSVLLHELGRYSVRYNPFDIFQDGNTVKRFLTANQWLIYWLTTYGDEVGDEYETSCKIHVKGTDFAAARVYGTVTVGDHTMAAEPVRRVEDFERETAAMQLREKIGRLALLFNNLDQLYHGNYEISFPQRPVIVLICEDDEHIREVWDIISPILPEIGEQEIWMTSDLRIFNYNMRGERFLRMEDGEPVPIDLTKVLGVGEEPEGYAFAEDEAQV